MALQKRPTRNLLFSMKWKSILTSTEIDLQYHFEDKSYGKVHRIYRMWSRISPWYRFFHSANPIPTGIDKPFSPFCRMQMFVQQLLPEHVLVHQPENQDASNWWNSVQIYVRMGMTMAQRIIHCHLHIYLMDGEMEMKREGEREKTDWIYWIFGTLWFRISIKFSMQCTLCKAYTRNILQ